MTRRTRRFMWGLAVGVHILAGSASAQTGACCRGDGVCLATDIAGCSVLAGEFLGAGTPCAPGVCLGACCIADKACLENSRNACTAATGSFQGAGSTCELNCPSHLGTAFTYQGQLKEGGAPVTDAVDLEFSLWTAGEGGEQVGATQTVLNVSVVNGLFSVSLDFGTGALAGNSRWLEAGVRRPHDPTDTAPFVGLSPRQEITAAPYATTALSALSASSVPGLDGHSLNAADGSPIDALLVDTNGRVGIGTTSPTTTLDIVGTPGIVRLANTGGSVGPVLQLVNPNAGIVSADVCKISFSLGESGSDHQQADVRYGNSGNESVRFLFVDVVGGVTATREAMRIVGDGKVGIGTTTPGVPLHVEGGDDVGPTGGGFVQLGSSAALNLVMDDNEIAAHENGNTSTLRLNNNGGNVILTSLTEGFVGIGATPDAKLHVATGSSGVGLLNFSPAVIVEGSGTTLVSMLTPDGSESGLVFGSPGNDRRGAVVFNSAEAANGLSFRTGGVTTRMVIDSSGDVGIGNTSPDARLQVVGGLDATLGDNGGSLLLGGTGGLNIVMDTDDIMARSNGAPSRLFLNREGGDVYLVPQGAGNVGIGTPQPDARLHVSKGSSGLNAPSTGTGMVLEDNDTLYLSLLTPLAEESGILFANPDNAAHGAIVYNNTAVPSGLQFRTGGNQTRMIINDVGNITIGRANSNDARMHLASDSPTRPLKVDLRGGDGQLVAWARDDTVIGNVSVAAGAVSYNAFTGSHYAWSERDLPVMALVSMTGENRRFGRRNDSEVVYGVVEAARANDPACLGVLLGRLDPALEKGPENPLLVAAVGNGELCVVDRGGGDVHPGDYLISSDHAGCTMKDDPARFPIGHIVARAAERVKWADVAPDGHGTRQKRISVLFESFVRDSAKREPGEPFQVMQKELEDLKREIEMLRARLPGGASN